MNSICLLPWGSGAKDAKQVAVKDDKDETLDVNEPIVAAPAIVLD